MHDIERIIPNIFHGTKISQKSEFFWKHSVSRIIAFFTISCQAVIKKHKFE